MSNQKLELTEEDKNQLSERDRARLKELAEEHKKLLEEKEQLLKEKETLNRLTGQNESSESLKRFIQFINVYDDVKNFLERAKLKEKQAILAQLTGEVRQYINNTILTLDANELSQKLVPYQAVSKSDVSTEQVTINVTMEQKIDAVEINIKPTAIIASEQIKKLATTETGFDNKENENRILDVYKVHLSKQRLSEMHEEIKNKTVISGYLKKNYAIDSLLPMLIDTFIMRAEKSGDSSHTSRTQILEDIARSFSEHQEAVLTDSHYKALQGLGGVGKTMLALKYAEIHIREYQVIGWIPADKPLEESFETFVKQTFHLVDNVQVTRSESIDFIKTAYKSLSQIDNWLLIFDDVKDYKSIQSYLPTTRQHREILGSNYNKKRHILITTRHGDWPIAQIIKVGGFTEAEIHEYARGILGDWAEENDYLNLARVLENHPLALVHAARYINTMMKRKLFTISDYINELNEIPEVVLTYEDVQSGSDMNRYQYPRNVFKALLLSVNTFLESAAVDCNESQLLAEQVLRCLTYLEASNIPETLIELIIQHASFTKKEIINQKIEKIREHLINSVVVQHDKKTHQFNLHKLMLYTLRTKFKDRKTEDFTIMIESLAKGFSYDRYHIRADREHSKIWVSQILTVIQAREAVNAINQSMLVKLYTKLGTYYLFEFRYYEKALSWFQHAESLLNSCLVEIDLQAEIFNGLGYLYQNQDINDKAESYFQKTLDIYGDTLEKVSHLNSVFAVTILGYMKVRRSGKNTQAQRLFQISLDFLDEKKSNEREYANERGHAYGGLAYCHFFKGEHRAALRLRKQALKHFRRCLPENHPDVYDILLQLADSYHAIGKHEKGIKIAHQVQANSSKLFGEKSIAYIYYCYILCRRYQENRQVIEAENVQQHIWSILKANLDLLENENDKCALLFKLAEIGDIKTLKWLLREFELNIEEKDANKNTVLLIAAMNGHLSMLKWLLEEEANIKQTNDKGDTVLILAATTGNIEMVKWLLETRGTNIKEANKSGVTALLSAAMNGHVDIVKWLLQKGEASIKERDNNGNTALLLAAVAGSLETIQWLLKEGGASITEMNQAGTTTLLFASMNGHVDIVKWLLQKGGASIKERDNNGNTALLLAAVAGSLETIQWLLKEGGASITEMNQAGTTTLLFASMNGHFETVQWLLKEGGANLKEVTKKGDTAFNVAVNYKHYELGYFLGTFYPESYYNFQDDPILFWAIRNHQSAFVKYLVKRNPILLEQKNASGYTPLSFTIALNYPSLVEWLVLISQGTLLRAKTGIGESVLLLAIINQNKRVVSYLLQQSVELSLKEQKIIRLITAILVQENDEFGLWLKERIKMAEADRNNIFALIHKEEAIAYCQTAIKDGSKSVQAQAFLLNIWLKLAGNFTIKDVTEQLLQHVNWQIRYYAVRLLATSNLLLPEAVTTLLINIFNIELSPMVRIGILEALCYKMDQSQKFATWLTQSLSDPDPYVALYTMHYLQRLSGQSELLDAHQDRYRTIVNQLPDKVSSRLQHLLIETNRFPSAYLTAIINLRLFAEELGLSDIIFDENNTCILVIDDKFSIHLTFEPNSERLYLYSPLLDGIPEDKDRRLVLYERLLQGSMLGGQMVGGGVGIAVKEGLILMHCTLDMRQADALVLRNFAPLYVETVEKWRAECQEISTMPKESLFEFAVSSPSFQTSRFTLFPTLPLKKLSTFKYAELNLTEFSKELKLDNLKFDENNTCILGIDDKFSIHLTFEPNSERLYLYSPLLDGIPKDKDRRLVLYERLLQGSMLGGQMVGGGVGIAVKEGLILMHCTLDMRQADALVLRNFVPLYVETVEKWLEICSSIILSTGEFNPPHFEFYSNITQNGEVQINLQKQLRNAAAHNDRVLLQQLIKQVKNLDASDSNPVNRKTALH